MSATKTFGDSYYVSQLQVSAVTANVLQIKVDAQCDKLARLRWDDPV